MKIALFGYGKMGRMIEETAIARGHDVILKIDVSNRESLTAKDLQQADAAIDFTAPGSAVGNILFCLQAGVPVVVGTTGWYQELERIKLAVAENDGSLVYASNFSIGVNMMFAMNRLLAGWMNNFPEYVPSVEEVHHTQKLDAPSGTALTLADGILENLDRLQTWEKRELPDAAPTADHVLRINYARTDDVPGIHKVAYTSSIDRIEISHEAFNRKGFALGAVFAAEYIKDKKGIFTTKDIFGF